MTVTTGAGLPVAAWRARLDAGRDIISPAERPCRVLVVAAHPDDETLGLAGTIQRLLAQRCTLRLVVATDGDAAYGLSASTEGLAATRRAELRRALRVLRIGRTPVLPGLPDGELQRHVQVLGDRLAEVEVPDLLLAPWEGDPHPDHRAAASAASAYAHHIDRPLWQYPIWMRHWTAPDDPAVPLGRLRVLRLSQRERQRKARAIACHASQVNAFAGRAPVLPDYVLAHFADGLEPLFAPAQS